jgi:phosphatidylserine/phosphatidylglycerophosphate/cardiolipin synthase-like enzyme/uncharacterized membrane protein YdjX (TVP38/TMEM64 family)
MTTPAADHADNSPSEAREPVQRTGPAWMDDAEWVVHSDRIAPLVDGVEYYRALRAAILRAQRRILIVGWDLHSEIDLLRGREADAAIERDGHPVRLADLLERMVEERPKLRVSILIWAGSPLFAFERQHLPRMKRPWSSHDRIDLVWDRVSPPLASQHQKIVVIDDRVAFVGGMDITQSRWDDHAHRREDPRRRKPGLLPSFGHPYHDIMLALDGEAAEVVARWSRERWARAADSELEPEAAAEDGDAAVERDEEADLDPWPPHVEPILRDRVVALTLTQPDLPDRPGRRQVESTYLAQIAQARRFVFVENQYFSSETICDALCDRLREPEGPEVILVLPYGCPGTVQSMALDTQRDRLLERLREADRHDRLGVYWPTLAGGDEEDVHENAVYVHAKTLVVDDQLLRIGSANLANRSMGLDSELDASIWIEEDDAEARDAVAHYRRRLLAYLLSVDVERVAETEAHEGTLRATIERLRDGARTLHPFDHRADVPEGIALPIELADPDGPLDPTEVLRATRLVEASEGLLQTLVRTRNRAIAGLRHHRRRIALAALAVLAIAFFVTPLRDAVDAGVVRGVLDAIRSGPMGDIGVFAAFSVAAAVGVPVTLLIAAVGAALGAAPALVICLAGVAVSAALGFAIGRRIPATARERRLGGRMGVVAARLKDRSVLALAILRNIPIAPYAIVNIACGATPIGWVAFLTGTLLGMAPGIVLASVFGEALGDWLADPTLIGALRAGAVLAAMIAAALLADRYLATRLEDEPNEHSGEVAG